MISAKDAREFVTDMDRSFHTQLMDGVINALYHGRLHAEYEDIDMTESDVKWLEELGYKVHMTSDKIYLYWA